jgi:hypothetical protein
MAYRPYPDLFARLMANTHEPENDRACWAWSGKRDRWGYGRVNVYVPGLGAVVTLMAHLAVWLWVEAGCTTADDLWLAYQELQASGLEIDHLCVVPNCVHPDHHEPVTSRENSQRRDERNRSKGFSYA